VRYAGERKQFDKTIGEFDAIRAMLADSAVEVATARLLTYQAAWLRDQGRPHVKEASLAKWHASEAATRCANWAVQVHGGYGYLTEFTVERLWRDARICEIYEGTTEVQKMVVAAQVLKEQAVAAPRS
jgi:butyryl-CoA dehydrogenase